MLRVLGSSYNSPGRIRPSLLGGVVGGGDLHALLHVYFFTGVDFGLCNPAVKSGAPVWVPITEPSGDNYVRVSGDCLRGEHPVSAAASAVAQQHSAGFDSYLTHRHRHMQIHAHITRIYMHMHQHKQTHRHTHTHTHTHSIHTSHTPHNTPYRARTLSHFCRKFAFCGLNRLIYFVDVLTICLNPNSSTQCRR